MVLQYIYIYIYIYTLLEVMVLRVSLKMCNTIKNV